MRFPAFLLALLALAGPALAQSRLQGQRLGDGTTGPADNLTVKPNGATTARPLKERAADEVHAKDYGVKCDYNPATSTGTDDTAALQAAINAGQSATAQGGGRRIKLPAGNCLTGTLLISGQADIEGAGSHATVLHLKASATGPAIRIETSGYDFVQLDGYPNGNIALSHLRLTSTSGATSGLDAQHGIQITVGANEIPVWIRLDDVVIYNMPGSGIKSGPFNGFLQANKSSFVNNGQWGTDTNSVYDFRFIECDWSTNRIGNLRSSGDAQMFLLNPNIYAAGGWGVVAYQTDMKIVGGSIDANLGGGLQFTAAPTRSMRVILTGGLTFGSNSRGGTEAAPDIAVYGSGGPLQLLGSRFTWAPHAINPASKISHNIRFMDGGPSWVDARDVHWSTAQGVYDTSVVNDVSRVLATFQANGGTTMTGPLALDGSLRFKPLTLSAAPTTSNLAFGFCALVKNTSNGTLRFYCNDEGVIHSGPLFD